MEKFRDLFRYRYIWIGLLSALVLAFFLKFPCSSHFWDGYQYQSWCYSDIMALYGPRHFDLHAFPYFSTDLEYPVGIGLLAGTVGLLTNSLVSFFLINSLVLGLLAGVTLWCLQQLGVKIKRLYLFALAPTLILYAFLNWDLLPVALVALALVAFKRGDDRWAGLWLGLGAASKLFPGLLLPGLLVSRLVARRQMAWQLIGGAVGGFLLLNLPIYLADPAGWWYPWQFQAERFPNFETVWFFIYHHFGAEDISSFWWTTYPKLTSWLSLGLFGLALTWLLFQEWFHKRSRPLVISFVTLILFLLTAKIFSPQYLLWLVPFLVVLPLPHRAVIGFFAVDLITWAAVTNHLLVANTPAAATPLLFLELAVLGRYIMLAWLGYLAYHLPVDEKPVQRL